MEKPTKGQEYRKGLADKLKEIRKEDPEHARNLLEKESKSGSYKYFSHQGKEIETEVNNLVKEGKFQTEEDAREYILEKIKSQDEEFDEWFNNDCSPDNIPKYILEDEKSPKNEVWRQIDLRAHEYFLKKNESYPEISKLISEIHLEDWDVEVTDEQRMQIKEILDKGDEAKKLLFIHLNNLQRFNRVTFGCGRDFGFFKKPSGCGDCNEARENFEKLFGEEIPDLESLGDRQFRTKKVDEIDYAYGSEKIERVRENLKSLDFREKEIKDEEEKKKRQAAAIEKEKKTKEMLDRQFGDKLQEAVDKLPELVEFVKETQDGGIDTSNRYASLKEVDIEKQLAVFLGGRSEYGSSGGIGRWDIISCWRDGEIKSQEFQYRDRWSASNDNYQYHYEKLKIKEIVDDGDQINVTVLATPYGDFANRVKDLNFSFKKKEEVDRVRLPAISPEDESQFKSLVKSKAEELVKEKAKKYVGKTRFVKDPVASGYYPYEDPKLEKLVSNNRGYATFVIKETIDYGSPVDVSMPQERSELYVMKFGDQEPVQIFEDHAYVVQVDHPAYSRTKGDKYYGDPAVTILNLKDNFVEYSSRSGTNIYEIK